MPGRAKAARAEPKSASKRDRVRALCEALPHAEHAAQRDHDTYRVRGKVFAYFLDNHHGDGIAKLDGAKGALDNRRRPGRAARSRGVEA